MMAFLGLIIFLLGFQCGWGPLALLVSTELTSPQHRGTVSGLAVATCWIASFFVTQTFHPVVTALRGNTLGADAANNLYDGSNQGSGTLIVFLAYSALTAFATMFFYRQLPETNIAFLPESRPK